MQARQFVEAVYVAVYRAAIDGVGRLLIRPPGRHPRRALTELSDWYNGLDEYERGRVQEVIRLSVDQAVFGMLAALDGSRSLGPDASRACESTAWI
jgi:hypothetical protein